MSFNFSEKSNFPKKEKILFPIKVIIVHHRFHHFEDILGKNKIINRA